MEGLLEDLRQSMRALRRRPLFFSTAVVTLALGIGANTAMYSVIHAVVLSPLPYPAPDRLVRLQSAYEGRACCTISAPNYLDMRARTRQFEDIVAYTPASFNVTGGGEPVRLTGYRVSDGFFELFGAPPQVGRFIRAEDQGSGAEPVVVLSDRLWRDRFEADPKVVGTSIVIEAVPHTVIGVAPPRFRLTGRPRMFVPFAWDPANMPSRNGNFLVVIGRLRPETTLDAAIAELSSIYGSLVAQYPEITNTGVAGMALGDWLLGANQRRALLVLWGAVAMVLLVACANVINLMLARAEARQQELAVRAALGAGRGRFVRHFLTESLLVSFIGAGLGVAGAHGGLRFLAASYGVAVPRADEVGISSGVLLFTLAASIATGLVVGLVPALKSSRSRLSSILQEGGRGSAGGMSRLRRGLVIAEVAAAMILVLGAGLLLKSFWRINQVDVGVDAQRILTLRVSLPWARYSAEPRILAFFETFRDELKRLPAVEDAGIVTAVPFSGTESNFSGVTPVGEPELKAAFVEVRMASPDFFTSMGLSLVEGRNFTGADSKDAPPVTIINRTLAGQLFPRGSPVGRQISPGPDERGWEVVGVVEDVHEHGPDVPPPPIVYFPHLQNVWSTMSLTLRTAGEPLQIVPQVRQIARRLDAELPLFGISRLDQLIDDRLSPRRFSVGLLAIFAGIALILGAVGIYGVMAYSVERRRREIGLRQALGASSRSVLQQVVAQGTRLTIVGVMIGALGAFFLRSTLSGLLFDVHPLDPATFAVVAVVLLLVAVVACFVPARRAAAVDPMVALREE